jgi:hypothetical protein
MDKIDFIAAAINDTQNTIRATDVKVAALLTAMLLPLSLLGKIWAQFLHLSSVLSPYFAVVSGVLFFLTWITSVAALIRTISAIDNPASHIVNSGSFKGSFYGGGLYSFSFIDTFFNRDVIKAKKDVTSFSKDYPNTNDGFIEELTFEHIKLIYIREIKLFRLSIAIKAAQLWFLVGLAIYVLSKMS